MMFGVFYCTRGSNLFCFEFSQIKLLLEMLVKKFGLDAVKAVMPEEHVKLLTNIRKVCLYIWYSFLA